MNIGEAQQKVLKLVRLAASAPDTEEARTAASKAACLIAEHGLLIMKPSDLVHVVDASHEVLLARIAELEAALQAALRDAPPVGTKKRRKRPNAKAIQETMTTAAETARTAAETAGAALDAASRVAKAVNGFRNAIRGG